MCYLNLRSFDWKEATFQEKVDLLLTFYGNVFNNHPFTAIMGIIRRVMIGIIAIVVVIVALVVLFSLSLIAISGAIVIAIIAIIVGLFRRIQQKKYQKTVNEKKAQQDEIKAGPVLDIDYKVKSKE